MQLLPADAKKIEIEGATVDFYTFIQDGTTNYYFDTSECGPPEPMVNAMAGLQLLDENSKWDYFQKYKKTTTMKLMKLKMVCIV